MLSDLGILCRNSDAVEIGYHFAVSNRESRSGEDELALKAVNDEGVEAAG